MLSRIVAAVLVISPALPYPAQAAMLAIDSGQRDEVNRLLDRADVQSRLQAYGVSADDVKARVAAMTDVELAQLAERIIGFTKVFPFTKPIE